MIDFPNVTENFALNFINSRIFRNGNYVELIKSIDDLREWAEVPLDDKIEHNTQLSIFNTCLDQVTRIEEVIKLRNELHECLTNLAENTENIEVLKNEIEEFTINHPFTIIFVDDFPLYVPLDSGVTGMKSLMYLSLSELIKNGEMKKIACCANEECPLLFINQSGRRKWCSMKICGNRNKVERFLEKNKQFT